jgi:hypothetical protein
MTGRKRGRIGEVMEKSFPQPIFDDGVCMEGGDGRRRI